MQAEPIHLLIHPFINELAKGEDERLNEHIEERIFNHLVNFFHNVITVVKLKFSARPPMVATSFETMTKKLIYLDVKLLPIWIIFD